MYAFAMFEFILIPLEYFVGSPSLFFSAEHEMPSASVIVPYVTPEGSAVAHFPVVISVRKGHDYITEHCPNPSQVDRPHVRMDGAFRAGTWVASVGLLRGGSTPFCTAGLPTPRGIPEPPREHGRRVFLAL